MENVSPCIGRWFFWECMDCSPPGSSVHEVLQAWSKLPFPPPGDLPDPGIKRINKFSYSGWWCWNLCLELLYLPGSHDRRKSSGKDDTIKG